MKKIVLSAAMLMALAGAVWAGNINSSSDKQQCADNCCVCDEDECPIGCCK